jgi:hypothetical protein
LFTPLHFDSVNNWRDWNRGRHGTGGLHS